MSKAFTREDDGAAEAPIARRLMTSEGPVRLTPEGHAAFTAELQSLAGAEGEGKARAELLTTLLAHAEIIEPAPNPERAAFGVYVTVEDEDGELKTWRLVGPEEADAREGRLSIEAPVGRALLGKEVGDTVVVERPRGALELTVRELRGAS